MPAEVAYRRATLDDAPRLALLDLASRSEHWSLQTYVRELSPQPDTGPQRLAWVAEQDKLLIAFAWFSLLLDTAELENIVVSETARRSGIASGLLEQAFSALSAIGARVVQLEVRAKNTAALSLYGRHGFKQDGLRRSYYKDDDAVLMSRRLP